MPSGPPYPFYVTRTEELEGFYVVRVDSRCNPPNHPYNLANSTIVEHVPNSRNVHIKFLAQDGSHVGDCTVSIPPGFRCNLTHKVEFFPAGRASYYFQRGGVPESESGSEFESSGSSGETSSTRNLEGRRRPLPAEPRDSRWASAADRAAVDALNRTMRHSLGGADAGRLRNVQAVKDVKKSVKGKGKKRKIATETAEGKVRKKVAGPMKTKEVPRSARKNAKPGEKNKKNKALP